ncbi:hypothetical protein V493_03051 [Pseudogymnoascus sp. VKM F-4281 (FW-2241)]|nr:hypothetical protein V493_03051 [Pseudogymnoascus sp. VKM F-4281 (FW-2241)]
MPRFGHPTSLSTVHHTRTRTRTRSHAPYPSTTPRPQAITQSVRETMRQEEPNPNQIQSAQPTKTYSPAASSQPAQTSPRPSRPVPKLAKSTLSHPAPTLVERGLGGAEEEMEGAGSALILSMLVRELTVPSRSPP